MNAPSLALPAELTIYKAAELRDQWLAWLQALPATSKADTCCADGAAVAEADGAGMQLLVSLSHALARRHRVLRIARPSDTLRRACESLGLQAMLLSEERGQGEAT